MKPKIQIKEVGPRDGLQNEKQIVSVNDKIQLIRHLIQAGEKHIEITAFVNPKAIPQMGDAEELSKKIVKPESVVFSALVPNVQGMNKVLEIGIFDEIAVFTAASETFNQKNIHASIRESYERFEPVMKLAQKNKIRVRGYVSTAFYCPFEGKIKTAQVLPVIQKLLDMGCYEVSVGDTIGKAAPTDVEKTFQAIDRKGWIKKMAGHFHDTYGMALANVSMAMECGVKIFDSSVGGLGGCPYAPGASGNLATEDLVFMLEQMGISTGIDIQKLMNASTHIQQVIGHPLPSKTFQALRAKSLNCF